MFNGKRLDRIELPKQLRVDADMGRCIRNRAALNRRTIQQEILHLLERALQSEEVGISHGSSDRINNGSL